MIRPEFFTDADLLELPPLTRLLFIGLWTLADREGRLRDRPKNIKLAVLPGDDGDVDAMLDDLERAGSIRRYEVDGEHLIDIPGFVTYQHCHFREAASTLPPFKFTRAKKVPNSREAQGQPEANPMPALGQPVASTSASTSTSTSEKTLKALSLRSDDRQKSPPDDGFDKFWNRYPKKAGKKDAHVRWRKMDAGQRERAYYVAEAIAFAVANGYREMEFVPMGSTFLNSERYEDWYDEKGEMIVPGDYSPGGNGKGRKKQRDIDASIVRAMNSIDWPEEES